MRKKHFVGITDKGFTNHLYIYSDQNTLSCFRIPYQKLIGPFKTKASALYYQKYLSNNPHIGCVADAEFVFKRSKDIKNV